MILPSDPAMQTAELTSGGSMYLKVMLPSDGHTDGWNMACSRGSGHRRPCISHRSMSGASTHPFSGCDEVSQHTCDGVTSSIVHGEAPKKACKRQGLPKLASIWEPLMQVVRPPAAEPKVGASDTGCGKREGYRIVTCSTAVAFATGGSSILYSTLTFTSASDAMDMGPRWHNKS